MLGIIEEGRFVEHVKDTQGNLLYCTRCNSPVYGSTIEGYSSQCLSCDEDLYSFETTIEGDPGPIIIGRYPEGISLNMSLGYEFLQKNGEPMVFSSLEDAKVFLKSNDVPEDTLDEFFYIEKNVQDIIGEITIEGGNNG